jgi:hypothetical protein
MTRTVRKGLWAILVVLMATSCRRVDPIASQPRVILHGAEENAVERLTRDTYAVQQAVADDDRSPAAPGRS